MQYVPGSCKLSFESKGKAVVRAVQGDTFTNRDGIVQRYQLRYQTGSRSANLKAHRARFTNYYCNQTFTSTVQVQATCADYLRRDQLKASSQFNRTLEAGSLRTIKDDGARLSFDASQNEANAALSLEEGASNAFALPGTGTSSGSQIDSVQLGFGSASTRSAMVSDRDFALRNRSSVDLGIIPGDTNINGNTGRSATAGQEQQAFRGALISDDAAGNASDAVFDDTTIDRDHEYLRWGWWNGEFSFDDDDTTDFAGRRERVHLGTWIAGNRVADSIVGARRGGASFDGHAVVSVSDANGQSVDGGRFTMTYDFDGGSGQANFRDLAGYDFDVPVSGNEPGGGSHYTGGLVEATATGRPTVNVGVSGSFFGNDRANDIRATAGQIDFESSNGTGSLRASGTFGGDIVPGR